MYEINPKIDFKSKGSIIIDNKKILDVLKKNNKILIECYPGTDYNDLNEVIISNLEDYDVIFLDDYSLAEEDINIKTKDVITDDRIFGKMNDFKIEDFYDESKIKKINQKFSSLKKVIVFGFGVSQLISGQDCLIHMNLARWEIQRRLREGLPNWKANNESEENSKKFKRGYFLEWRIADNIKKQNILNYDYFIDANDKSNYKMIEGNKYIDSLRDVVKSPLRLVPFFDPGVWGGQWMKEHFNLNPEKINYAWSFDGVVEENSLYLEYENGTIEVPSIDMLFANPKDLLGDKVYKRFGAEFPIRFDYLDTIGGQNLSLQVHPTNDYIKEKFNMEYTQDESYYIMHVDEEEDPCVYIGLKEGIDEQEMFEELERANKGEIDFDVEKFVNKIPCKKGDHFLIPAGTVHCSGKGVLVLEISSTPYIFTFKLWDWSRVDLDGKPRPINLEHAKKVINFKRDTNFVYKELYNNFETISDVEEKTGLHELEFIETRRFNSKCSIDHNTEGSVNVLNVVGENDILVYSKDEKFKEQIYHHGETFIIPEYVKEYSIKPLKEEEIIYIKAYVR